MNLKKQFLFGFMLVTAGMVCQNAVAFKRLLYPLNRYKKTIDSVEDFLFLRSLGSRLCYPLNRYTNVKYKMEKIDNKIENIELACKSKLKNAYEFVKNAHKNGLKNQFEYELIKDFENNLREKLTLEYTMLGDPNCKRLTPLGLHFFPENLSKSDREKMEEKIKDIYSSTKNKVENPKKRYASHTYSNLIDRAIEEKPFLKRMILKRKPELFRKTTIKVVNEIEKEKGKKPTTNWSYYREKYDEKKYGKDYARWAGGLPVREQSWGEYLRSFSPF